MFFTHELFKQGAIVLAYLYFIISGIFPAYFNKTRNFEISTLPMQIKLIKENQKIFKIYLASLNL